MKDYSTRIIRGKCNYCDGVGEVDYCAQCGKKMPCGGRDPVKMSAYSASEESQLPPCLREGRSDCRKYSEILDAEAAE